MLTFYFLSGTVSLQWARRLLTTRQPGKFLDLKKEKETPNYILPTRDSLQLHECTQAQNEEMGKDMHATGNQKRAEIAILIIRQNRL